MATGRERCGQKSNRQRWLKPEPCHCLPPRHRPFMAPGRTIPGIVRGWWLGREGMPGLSGGCCRPGTLPNRLYSILKTSCQEPG